MFRRAAVILLAAGAGFLLYLFLLNGVGLLGPDEPRYAAIGREMARSGDWITPRLYGAPWFEKPPLVYWMTAVGFTLGLGDELAPRLPAAALSLAFLAFYYWALRREFGAHAAAFATAILGASAGWIAYTRVAVMDVPLAATFSTAVLLVLQDRLRWAAAMLGLAVLAKGLVPLALVAPLAWFARRRLRQALVPALVFAAVAAPWYVLVTLRHGRAFVDEFFLEHHFGRFTTEALRHEQPFWFYVPVFLALLFPWTPLLPLLVRTGGDTRRRALLAVAAFGFVFFSASRNKLPGYLVPVLPASAALMGIALAEATRLRWLLAGAGGLAGLVAAVPAMLPAALQRGITHALWGGPAWVAAIGVPLAAVAAGMRREIAVAAITAVMAAGAGWTALTTFPVLDGSASARAFWREQSQNRDRLCVGSAHRSWRFGLDYYSVQPLPDCAASPRPLVIEHDFRRGPRVQKRGQPGVAPFPPDQARGRDPA